MSNERLDLPREAWETADYEYGPFDLSDIDVTQVTIAAKDFLPRPEELVLKISKPAQRKVTIVLDDFTIQAFKDKAHELGGSYQAMMRQLLFECACTFEEEREKELAQKTGKVKTGRIGSDASRGVGGADGVGGVVVNEE